MSNHISHGPGGVPIGEILDLADRLGRQIAALGITDRNDRNTFCTLLGESLTDKFLSTGVAEELRPYQERLAEISQSASDAYFTSDALELCAALGPWPGPAMEMRRAEAGTQAIVMSLVLMRKLIAVPASDFLDLFVWVQSAMLVGFVRLPSPDCYDPPTRMSGAKSAA